MRTRRRFLSESSTALAALALLPAEFIARTASAAGPVRSLDELNFPMFARKVNTRFRVRLPSGQAVQIKLVRASEAAPTPPVPCGGSAGDAGNEKFSLLFSGPKETPLPSAIHRFEHDQLGRFEMYIEQVGAPDVADERYEAVFNRPAPSGPGAVALT
jgi:hypothetical protein